MPHFVQKDGRHAFIVDGAPFLMLGGQSGNSSAWPSELPGVWSAVERIHANTLEVPVYWEQFEPEQGKYDPSIVDLMIRQAREHHVRLVLLWFGTWKNGSSHYIPLWMKARQELYPKIIGKGGQSVDSPSPHFPASLELDKSAFRALMAHLKAADPVHTVIMVQVENESGAWDTIRDYSPDRAGDLRRARSRRAPSGPRPLGEVRRQLDGRLRKGRRRVLPRVVRRALRGPGRSRGQGGLPAAHVRQRGAEGPDFARPGRHVRERRADGQRPGDLEGRRARARRAFPGHLPGRQRAVPQGP